MRSLILVLDASDNLPSSHPLPILNISEHLTRRKLQTNTTSPFSAKHSYSYHLLANQSSVIGALLGTQNGREVEIVNTFELALEETDAETLDHGFFVTRRDQCTYLY